MAVEFASPEAEKHSDELLRILNDPFESSFDPQRYEATFVLPVRQNAPVRRGNRLRNVLSVFTGTDIDPSAAWFARVGYVGEIDNVALTELGVPLQRTTQLPERFVLRRHEEDMYGLSHRLGSAEVPIPDPRSRDDKQLLIGGMAVRRIFADAGYGLPAFFTSPEDMRIAIGEIREFATSWAQQERASFVEDPLLHTVVRRALIKKRNEEKQRDEYTTEVLATTEYTKPSGTVKRGFGVRYCVEDYETTELDIESATYRLMSEHSQDHFRSRKWQKISMATVEPTEETLSQLIEAFRDTLEAKPE